MHTHHRMPNKAPTITSISSLYPYYSNPYLIVLLLFILVPVWLQVEVHLREAGKIDR